MVTRLPDNQIPLNKLPRRNLDHSYGAKNSEDKIRGTRLRAGESSRSNRPVWLSFRQVRGTSQYYKKALVLALILARHT